MYSPVLSVGLIPQSVINDPRKIPYRTTAFHPKNLKILITSHHYDPFFTAVFRILIQNHAKIYSILIFQ